MNVNPCQQKANTVFGNAINSFNVDNKSVNKGGTNNMAHYINSQLAAITGKAVDTNFNPNQGTLDFGNGAEQAKNNGVAAPQMGSSDGERNTTGTPP